MAGSVSPKSLNAFHSIEEALPQTTRQRHCSIEDIVRYAGGGLSFIGGGWCFYTQQNIAGFLLFGTGLLTVVEHLTEKNCGVTARIIKAAQKARGDYQLAINGVNQAAGRLQDNEEERKHNQDTFKQENEALLQEIQLMEQGIKGTEKQVGDYETENKQLVKTIQELRQRTLEQEKLIEKLNTELSNFTLQNNRLNQELKKITSIAETFNQTDQQIVQHAKDATDSFHKEISEFETTIQHMQTISQRVEQLKTENQQLQQEVQNLIIAKKELEADLQSAKEMEATRNIAHNEMSQLLTKLENHQKALSIAEAQIQEKINQLKKTHEHQAF